MNPLQVLKNHYVGKKIIRGVYFSRHIGKTILDIQVDNYEPMLEFLLEGSNGKEVTSVLFDWDIEVK